MVQSTYLLVHGAWHGSWCWRDLGLEFDRRGVSWRAVDLPSARPGGDPKSNLVTDAAVVASAGQLDGPVILVGHSYGGAVICQAAPLISNLERMIFVAALVPRFGESATDASREVKVRTELDEALEVNGDYLQLKKERAVAALYQDCNSEIQSWSLSQLSSQTLASFRSVRNAPDVTVPTHYVLCREDRALHPSLQERMALRADEVMFIASGHSPFLSHPKELADLLTI